MHENETNNIIHEVIQHTELLFTIAQVVSIYRSSIAYFLQNIRSFTKELKTIENKNLTQNQVEALKKFDETISHLTNYVFPKLGEQWLGSALQYSSVQFHKFIDEQRKIINDVCLQLEMDPKKILNFDPVQDSVNKTSDLLHLKKMLRDIRERKLSVPNSVDVQQMIEIRLRSISNRLPKKIKEKIQKSASDEASTDALQDRMDKELQNFNSKDIPCEELKFGEALGTGGFGTVYKATRLTTAELLAIKEVRNDKLTISAWASLYSEVSTMAPLSKHKYVLELVGTHIKKPYRIITRYCSGKSLFERLHRSNNPLSSQKLTAIAYQVAEGMRFLHSNRIVHRDLKTMNILLDENDVAKIADFGLAGIMKGKSELFGGVGTPHYTAPEVLERKKYGAKVDVYSYGVILWEMASRQIPYRDKGYQEIYDHVVNRGWRLPFSNSFPDCLKKVISRCWSGNPSERPDFTEIVDLFKENKLYFNGCEKITFDMLATPNRCPPLDFDYLVSVLKDPENKYFSNVISFLKENFDDKIRAKLREVNILDYYSANSQNTSSILLISSLLLEMKEFKPFINNVAEQIIKNSIESNDIDSILSSIEFCLKVPMRYFKMIKQYIPSFVSKINEEKLSPFIIQLVSRLNKTGIGLYANTISSFFTKKNIKKLPDQETLDAITKIIPFITENLSQKQINSCIYLLESNLDCSISLIKFLISNTSNEVNVRLATAIIMASAKSDVTECLVEVLERCDSNDISILAKKTEIFDQIHRLLEENKSIDASLIFLYRLLMDETVPMLLLNHPIINLILQVKGHTAQKLQIFTILFSSEQYCSNTTISDSIVKLIISTLNIETLTNYSLKLIGALSLHPTGCALINETGMLSLFSQMYLSSVYSDPKIPLLILTNLAKADCQIPDVSLIISCLMQDLVDSSINRSGILNTLIYLISSSPNSVQEHDLQYVVLSLLSSKQEPVINTLILQLFEACDMEKLKTFYQQIADKTISILSNDLMMYPELLNSAIDLLVSFSTFFDMTEFFKKTNFILFVNDIKEQIENYLSKKDTNANTNQIFEDVFNHISNCAYLLS